MLAKITVFEIFYCRLEQAQTAQRMVADDKQDLERQLEDIGCAKVSRIWDYLFYYTVSSV